MAWEERILSPVCVRVCVCVGGGAVSSILIQKTFVNPLPNNSNSAPFKIHDEVSSYCTFAPWTMVFSIPVPLWNRLETVLPILLAHPETHLLPEVYDFCSREGRNF